jgi:hypothetical protein
MKSYIAGFLGIVLVGAAGVAGAQEAIEPAPFPDTAAPTVAPPAPPSMMPAPPSAQYQAQIQVAPSAVSGQWVFTSQYGWVWMPYGAQYTYQPTGDDGVPCSYVYTVGYGWRWLEAPWVWGWGARPYFGVYGPARFAWYRTGWGYTGYGWRGYRNGYRWGGWNGENGYRAGISHQPYRPWHGGGGRVVVAPGHFGGSGGWGGGGHWGGAGHWGGGGHWGHR